MNAEDLPLAALGWMTLSAEDALAKLPSVPKAAARNAWHSKYNIAIRVKEVLRAFFGYLEEANFETTSAIAVLELLEKHDVDLEAYPEIRPSIFCREGIRSAKVWEEIRFLAKKFFQDNQLPVIHFDSEDDLNRDCSEEYSDFLLSCIEAGIRKKSDLPKF